jgi:hypothetical protein
MFYASGVAGGPGEGDALEERVLNALRGRGPLTVAGLCRVVRDAGQYPVHAALRRLEQRGLVRPAGALTPEGIAAARGTISVWEAVPTA